MAVISLYAGSSASLTSANLLPSPVNVTVAREQIWSEDTGRAQSGTNKAKMIGESITGKKTYAIKWGILNADEINKILDLLTRGFFYFGIGTPSSPPSDPEKYYRSEITYDLLQVGSERYYKDAEVSVIEQ